MKGKKILFAVTNDLSFDQRMNRICNALADDGWKVTLIGRKLNHSKPLEKKVYRQKRLYCFFTKGFFFYTEYNIRLFLYLLFNTSTIICSIDLDTILACYMASILRRTKRVHDAHELFTEMKEVKNNKIAKKVWTWIERFAIPKYKYGYTVCDSIAQEFKRRYGVNYATIRNMAVLKPLENYTHSKKTIVYAGAINEGRCFEILIPAMRKIKYPLIICGDGNYMKQLKALVYKYQVQNKVVLKGMLLPQELWSIIQESKIGIGLYEKNDLNQYWALPNKFFDYIQAGLPQVTMNYPEFQKVNNQHEVALLINDLNITTLANTVNFLMEDVVLYNIIKNNCLKTRIILCWDNEKKFLLDFYKVLI